MLHGEYKMPGGKLVIADVHVQDGSIREFRLSGDFFLEPDEALETIDGAVTGLSAQSTATDIATAVEQSLPADAVLMGISPLAVGIAVRRALSQAGRWRDLDWEIIRTPSLPPVMNVALDEVLLTALGEGRRGPTMRLWEWDSDAVIIGSFQSVQNEVDEDAARALDTQVIRRISGGGAMYMQPDASLTYSLYVPDEFVQGMSFAESYAFLDEWAIEALQTLGIDARYEPLNDITSPQGKIGGAAQKRLAAGAVLHHATLAYDMDGDRMERVLRIGREKLSDKGTTSAAKRVDPLRRQTELSRAEIMDHFADVFHRRHGTSPGEIQPEELERAEELVTEKFEHADWLYRVP